jgi:hypothetical protein
MKLKTKAVEKNQYNEVGSLKKSVKLTNLYLD